MSDDLQAARRAYDQSLDVLANMDDEQLRYLGNLVVVKDAVTDDIDCDSHVETT